jgi:hypothetical protein
MRQFFLSIGAALVLALAGCEEAVIDPVGAYEWRGFNCGGTLELRPNGSYRTEESVTFCIGGITTRSEERGRWAISGSQLELYRPRGPRVSYSVAVEGKGDEARRILQSPERFYPLREVTEQDRITRAERSAVIQREWEDYIKAHPAPVRSRK